MPDQWDDPMDPKYLNADDVDPRYAALGLTYGLVGKHRALYRENALFKQAVDTLARMLPIWVDGLADHAVSAQPALEQYMDQLTRPPGTFRSGGVMDGE